MVDFRPAQTIDAAEAVEKLPQCPRSLREPAAGQRRPARLSPAGSTRARSRRSPPARRGPSQDLHDRLRRSLVRRIRARPSRGERARHRPPRGGSRRRRRARSDEQSTCSTPLGDASHPTFVGGRRDAVRGLSPTTHRLPGRGCPRWLRRRLQPMVDRLPVSLSNLSSTKNSSKASRRPLPVVWRRASWTSGASRGTSAVTCSSATTRTTTTSSMPRSATSGSGTNASTRDSRARFRGQRAAGARGGARARAPRVGHARRVHGGGEPDQRPPG